MSRVKQTERAATLRRFKPYPAYKDSAIDWLGEIPAHWEVKRLKTIASVQLSNVDKKSVEGQKSVRLCNYIDVYYNEHITSDLDFMAATATSEQVRRFSLRAGDVLITKDSESWKDISVPAVVTSDLPDILCGYHLALVRPGSDCDGAFMARTFSAIGPRDQFQIAANGITRFGLSGDAIRTGVFAMPSLREQRAIATFVDRETAKIDGLIVKKERVIELLQEKRRALISRAVTKGLDPNVPTRDSGIEWLGHIPEHWRVLQLRRVVERFVDYRGKTPEKVPTGVPLVTARNVKGGQIDLSFGEEFIREQDYGEWMVRGLPEIGDVLITTEAPLGEAAQIIDPKIALAQRIILLKADRKHITSEYLKYYLGSGAGFGELFSRATGSTALGIKAWHLKEVLVTSPPVPEQQRIVELLNRETARIDEVISKVRQPIDRLQEYRSALISAAVTGKIDVREASG